MFSHAINQIEEIDISMVSSYEPETCLRAIHISPRPRGISKREEKENVRPVCVYIYIQKKPIWKIDSMQLSVTRQSSMLL